MCRSLKYFVDKSPLLSFIGFVMIPIIISLMSYLLPNSNGNKNYFVSVASWIIGLLLLLVPFYLIAVCNYFAHSKGLSLLLCIPTCIAVNMGYIVLFWLFQFKPIVLNQLFNAEFPSATTSTGLMQNIWFVVAQIILMIGLIIVSFLKLFQK